MQEVYDLLEITKKRLYGFSVNLKARIEWELHERLERLSGPIGFDWELLKYAPEIAERVMDLSYLYMVGLWEINKKIYKFNSEALRILFESEFSEIPVEFKKCLSNSCVFFEVNFCNYTEDKRFGDSWGFIASYDDSSFDLCITFLCCGDHFTVTLESIRNSQPEVYQIISIMIPFVVTGKDITIEGQRNVVGNEFSRAILNRIKEKGRKRPHVRGGHYKHVPIGARKNGGRKVIWIPPGFVNKRIHFDPPILRRISVKN